MLLPPLSLFHLPNKMAVQYKKKEEEGRKGWEKTYRPNTSGQRTDVSSVVTRLMLCFFFSPRVTLRPPCRSNRNKLSLFFLYMVCLGCIAWNCVVSSFDNIKKREKTRYLYNEMYYVSFDDRPRYLRLWGSGMTI